MLGNNTNSRNSYSLLHTSSRWINNVSKWFPSCGCEQLSASRVAVNKHRDDKKIKSFDGSDTIIDSKRGVRAGERVEGAGGGTCHVFVAAWQVTPR